MEVFEKSGNNPLNVVQARIFSQKRMSCYQIDTSLQFMFEIPNIRTPLLKSVSRTSRDASKSAVVSPPVTMLRGAPLSPAISCINVCT